jgi:hypothetical protein
LKTQIRLRPGLKREVDGLPQSLKQNRKRRDLSLVPLSTCQGRSNGNVGGSGQIDQ